MSADRLEEVKAFAAKFPTVFASDRKTHEHFDWLIAEVERYREALRQVTHYDVEAHHGPVDEGAEAAAFAAVSEIAAGALYHWEKQERPQ